MAITANKRIVSTGRRNTREYAINERQREKERISTMYYTFDLAISRDKLFIVAIYYRQDTYRHVHRREEIKRRPYVPFLAAWNQKWKSVPPLPPCPRVIFIPIELDEPLTSATYARIFNKITPQLEGRWWKIKKKKKSNFRFNGRKKKKRIVTNLHREIYLKPVVGSTGRFTVQRHNDNALYTHRWTANYETEARRVIVIFSFELTEKKKKKKYHRGNPVVAGRCLKNKRKFHRKWFNRWNRVFRNCNN